MNPEFERFKMQDIPNGIRRGQHLMNTAPEHIYRYVSNTRGFDCFYEIDPTAPCILRFLLFAELCWDVTDIREMDTARKLILEQIPLV